MVAYLKFFVILFIFVWEFRKISTALTDAALVNNNTSSGPKYKTLLTFFVEVKDAN